jgi:hypothetical protein
MSETVSEMTLGRVEPCSAGNAQRRPVLEARCRIQETGHLLRAQDDRQPPRFPHERQIDGNGR